VEECVAEAVLLVALGFCINMPPSDEELEAVLEGCEVLDDTFVTKVVAAPAV